MWQVPPERLLGGLATLPLAPTSAVTEAEVPGIIEQMNGRLTRRDARARAGDLWKATYVLMGARYSREVAQAFLRGVRGMSESTTWLAIVEEGEQKGEVRGEREIVLGLGETKFGPPGAKMRKRLNAISELPRWLELGKRVLTAPDWDALLADAPAAPAKPRARKGR